jgi:hypothetical protein
MSQKMFADVPAQEREAMLDANCLRPEEMPIKKFFTGEEMIDMRREYSDNTIQIGRKNEELKKVKQEVDAHNKPLIDQNTYLINNIRAGYVEANQQVYLFDDQESGMMNYYDNQGELVYSRRLMPHEKQTRIS